MVNPVTVHECLRSHNMYPGYDVNNMFEENLFYYHMHGPYKYGLVDDMLDSDYTEQYITIISLGRGNNRDFGNVDDLVGITKCHKCVYIISLARGANPDIRSLDHLIKDGNVDLDDIVEELRERRRRENNVR